MPSNKKKKVNIREVAKAAGTSVASVSRALRDTPSPNLSAAQRERILKVCEKLQYYPNEHTRRMFSRKANTVALYFPPFEPNEDTYEGNIIDANFGACMMGLQKYFAKHSIQLLLSEISGSFLSSKQHLKMVRGKMVDGIVIWGVTSQDKYIRDLLNENIPLIMVQNEKADCDCVKIIADDHGGMMNVVKQIVDAGHSRIAIMKPTQTSSAGAERYCGAIDGLAKFGLEPAYITKQSGFGHEFGLAAAEEILKNSPEATCIIAPNDMAAWGCIEYAENRGLRVPEDISVTGADGLKIPGKTVVSSYSYPCYKMGELGAEYMLKLISGEKISKRIILETDLVSGNTIGVHHGK